MVSRPERVNGHTGTETRPRLLREAAVGILRNEGNLDAATPRGRGRLSGRKVLLGGKNAIMVNTHYI